MSEQVFDNPHRKPIQVDLAPSHAEKIHVRTETLAYAGAAAIEAAHASRVEAPHGEVAITEVPPEIKNPST